MAGGSENRPTPPAGYGTMSSALPDAVNYHGWVLSLMRPHLGGRLLEVGFGHGQYTAELGRMAEHVLAVDCDPQCVAGAPALSDKVKWVVADVGAADFPQRVGESSFDVAVCLNVLEHIENDVAALVHIRQTLRPGGQLLLLVPAHPALFGRMDELAGHRRRYGRRSLAERLQAAGLAVSELRYFNPLGGVGWWLNAKMFRPRNLSTPMVNRQILWFDRWVLPASRLLGPLTSRFFGQSLWAGAVNPRRSGT